MGIHFDPNEKLNKRTTVVQIAMSLLEENKGEVHYYNDLQEKSENVFQQHVVSWALETVQQITEQAPSDFAMSLLRRNFSGFVSDVPPLFDAEDLVAPKMTKSPRKSIKDLSL